MVHFRLKQLGIPLFALIGLMFCTNGYSSDTSADTSTFVNIVKESEGFMIRVELNEDGLEDGSTAAARLYLGNAFIDSGTDLEKVWGDSYDVSDIEQITEDDINSDSSTWGWFNYRRSGYHDRYYDRYRPYYYNRGFRYDYGRPNYRTYYRNPGYGYRYYYYPRYY
ncbi:MAG: hypothetical protein ACOH5I_19875 [Oligoflexus sp.]